MPEFDDRQRTFILTALWKLQAPSRPGRTPPLGAASEQRGTSEQAPGVTIDQIHSLVAKMGRNPDLPLFGLGGPAPPNSAAGTTHASRLRVRNASLGRDWTARHPDSPQPVARLKTAHGRAWPDLEACALRDRASYGKDEVMNQDHGMPRNALDQLRSLTIALQMGVSGEAAAMTLGLEPAAYDFACALIVALTESGNLGIPRAVAT